MKTNNWQGWADADVLRRVTLRLIRAEEKERWDALICARHYLGNAHMVGRQLRYVAEIDGEWVGLLGWSAAAYHLKGREQWVGWDLGQLRKRRKFIVQNSRFLLLVERGKYPNLASRILSICCHRLSRDWEEAYGYPVLVAESFVDPGRFSGACYRAAGWERVGLTQGSRRSHRDFYDDDSTPKELWVKALHRRARRWLCAAEMPKRFARHEDPVMHCGYTAQQYSSLWERFNQLADRRARKGRLHRLAPILTLCALATLSGARGTRAIAGFGAYLNQRQLRLLRCYYSRKLGCYIPPSEPTIRRVLELIPAEEIEREVVAWEAEQEDELRRVAVDGKAVKQARGDDDRPLHLVSAVTHASGRLVAQYAVAEKLNEITAVRPMLKDVELAGAVVTADAMHAQQETARFLTQEKGADYLFSLKGNQPSVHNAAERCLDSVFFSGASAAGRDGEQGTRARRDT